MSSYAENKVPIIELNEENLIPGTKSCEATSHSVRRALEKYGCFIVVTEKIPTEIWNALFRYAMALYDLPEQTKGKLKPDFYGSGYGSNFKKMPLCEYFGIGNGENVQVAKDFANVMWPEGNDLFCEAMVSYCKVMRELEENIARMVFSSYGVEKYYHSFVQSSFYLTRFLKYRVPKENEINMGHTPHISKYFFSITATTTKGIEIETRDGEWVNFEPSSNTFLFMAGELFMAWSNGRIYAPVHRVVIREDEAKYSIEYSLFSNGTTKIPNELVDDENPLKFKPFNNLEFLKYCAERGQATLKNAIAAYCGT